jgi:hypothetical protein
LVTLPGFWVLLCRCETTGLGAQVRNLFGEKKVNRIFRTVQLILQVLRDTLR